MLTTCLATVDEQDRGDPLTSHLLLNKEKAGYSVDLGLNSGASTVNRSLTARLSAGKA